MKKPLAAGIFFASVLAVPMMAFAAGSSYSVTYDFDTNLKGQVRSYSGNDITFDLSSSTYNGTNIKLPYFTASLYRSNTFIDDFIGSFSAQRNGYSSNTWTGVGAGNYYSSFNKANDGVWVQGSGSFYN